MKVKRQPSDFLVEERTSFVPDGGPFALYLLHKRSIGTLEALAAVRQSWNLARPRVSFGGLKDRHAETCQYVTIERGPRRDLHQSSFDLTYRGQASRPFGPKDIAGNRFRIVMRDLSNAAAGDVVRRLEEARADGLPNYFDDQRFGSLGRSGEFVAAAWCRGDYERALWLALADPNPHDRPHDADQKERLRRHWGNWKECKGALDRSHRRSLVTFLADRPGDFKGAFARLDPDLRSLFLAAFQSHLWNRILAARLRDVCSAAQLLPVALKHETILFYRGLDPAQKKALDLPLPLPSARLREDPMMPLVERVLSETGLELKSLRIKHPKDSFFSKGSRRARIEPEAVKAESGRDEIYEGKRRVTLAFDLPRGSYATLLIKRLTQTADAG